MKNTAKGYGSVARILHGLIFVLVLVLLIVGFLMGDVPKESKGIVYNIHKLTGLTVLFLMIFRLIWALINVKPSALAGVPKWQRKAERIVHGSLYFFLIAMPLVGWLGASAGGKPPHLGDWKLGLPLTENKDLAGAFFEFHEIIAYILIALIAIHVSAAMYHHFIKKDGLLRRMF